MLSFYNTVLMIWVSLGTKNALLGKGRLLELDKDHVCLKMPVWSPQTQLEIVLKTIQISINVTHTNVEMLE